MLVSQCFPNSSNDPILLRSHVLPGPYPLLYSNVQCNRRLIGRMSSVRSAVIVSAPPRICRLAQSVAASPVRRVLSRRALPSPSSAVPSVLCQLQGSVRQVRSTYPSLLAVAICPITISTPILYTQPRGTANALKVLPAHALVPIVPIQTLITPLRSLLARIVELALRLAAAWLATTRRSGLVGRREGGRAN